jgi:hypothetical protein
VTPCNLVGTYQFFGGSFWLNIRGWKLSCELLPDYTVSHPTRWYTSHSSGTVCSRSHLENAFLTRGMDALWNYCFALGKCVKLRSMLLIALVTALHTSL